MKAVTNAAKWAILISVRRHGEYNRDIMVLVDTESGRNFVLSYQGLQ